MKSRSEPFGAIVEIETPRALIFVGERLARLMGHDEPPRIPAHQPADQLSAPIEAHLVITRKCQEKCPGCYVDAVPDPGPELDLQAWKRVIDDLAKMRVFHVALGGGESLELPWLLELAEHARSKGVTPNLTTNGLQVTDRETARQLRVFGQINVSVDGMPARHQRARGGDSFDRAIAALRLLREQKRHVGINCVVTRETFEDLDAMASLCKSLDLSELELLRFKPAGRGTRLWDKARCTDAQHRAFLPTLLDLTKRHRVRIKVDCSYVPMIAAHEPDPEVLRGFGVVGCEATNWLMAMMRSPRASSSPPS